MSVTLGSWAEENSEGAEGVWRRWLLHPPENGMTRTDPVLSAPRWPSLDRRALWDRPVRQGSDQCREHRIPTSPE